MKEPTLYAAASRLAQTPVESMDHMPYQLRVDEVLSCLGDLQHLANSNWTAASWALEYLLQHALATPFAVTCPGFYRQRDGNEAMVTTNRPHWVYPWTGIDGDGVETSWLDDGLNTLGETSPCDLVEFVGHLPNPVTHNDVEA